MPEQTCTIHGPGGQGEASVTIGSGRLALIAGPCVAESLDLCLTVARSLAEVCRRLDVPYVFKASYDKANRTSAAGYRGPGLKTGLEWLARVREEVGVPVLTDVHETIQAGPAAEVVDCVQIPAFLCRQTDLLLAAGRSGKAVNIKRGQFMAPWDMRHAVEKVRAASDPRLDGPKAPGVLLTERGTMLGYNRLVSDLRAIPIMQAFAPVVFDATHSVQEPGGLGQASGGQRQFAPVLAAAAVAAGADALFIETHPDPPNAKSDAAVMVPLEQMEALLRRCLAIHRASRDNPTTQGSSQG